MIVHGLHGRIFAKCRRILETLLKASHKMLTARSGISKQDAYKNTGSPPPAVDATALALSSHRHLNPSLAFIVFWVRQRIAHAT